MAQLIVNLDNSRNAITIGINPSSGSFPGDSDPPKYDEIVHWVDAPPPSYDSLFGKTSKIKKSVNCLGIFKSVAQFSSKTVGWFITDTVTLPIGMVHVGLTRLRFCPQQELFLPVFIIIGGSIGLLKLFLCLLVHFCKKKEEAKPEAVKRLRVAPCFVLIDYLVFGWFLIGLVWAVIWINEPNDKANQFPAVTPFHPDYNPNKANFCDNLLHFFTFWGILIIFVLHFIHYCFIFAVRNAKPPSRGRPVTDYNH